MGAFFWSWKSSTHGRMSPLDNIMARWKFCHILLGWVSYRHAFVAYHLVNCLSVAVRTAWWVGVAGVVSDVETFVCSHNCNVVKGTKAPA